MPKINHDGKTYDLEELVDSAKMLDALYAVGVDNWEGFAEALEIYDGEEHE